MLTRLRNGFEQRITAGPRWQRFVVLGVCAVVCAGLGWLAICQLSDIHLSARTQTWIVALCGLYVCVAGLTRNFLLGPHTVNWPPAPLKVRMGIIALLLASGFVGARGVMIAMSPVSAAPPQVANPGFTLLAVALAIYKTMMLWNTLEQWHPERYWIAMQRAACRYAAAFCPCPRDRP